MKSSSSRYETSSASTFRTAYKAFKAKGGNAKHRALLKAGLIKAKQPA